jgi:hypothetical protein
MSLNDSIIQGDTEPIPFVLEDDDGPVRIQTAVLVEWRMGSLREDVVLPSVIAATVIADDGTDALKGRGVWHPVSPQTNTPGVYAVRFRVVFSDGTQRTFPNGEPETLIIRRTTP